MAVRAVNQRIGTWLYLAAVGVLLALAVVQIVKSAGIEQSVVLALVVVAIAVAGVVAYVRSDAVVAWARFTAVLPIIALVVFLFASESSDLLRSAADIELIANGDDLPPVVFVVLDELPTKSIIDPDGEIDAVRFPNLAAFAQDATWYRHFTTVAPFTEQAVPALLSGRDPDGSGPLWTNHPDTLFTLLAPTHDLAVFESFTRLCGLKRCEQRASGGSDDSAGERLGDLFNETAHVWRERTSLGTHDVKLLDEYEEEIEGDDEQVSTALPPPENIEGTGFNGVLRAERGIERVADFVATLEPAATPSLHFLHVMLPHSPFRLYPEGQLYETPMYGSTSYAGSSENAVEWLSALTEQRHLLQAQYTDQLVGQVVRKLQKTDLYDDALVIFVADHGASYETGTGMRELEDTTTDSIAYAPFLMKAPGQTEGRVDDSNVMSVDVIPTIADVLDIPVGWDVDGVPVHSEAMRARGRSKYFFDYTNAFAPKLERLYRFDDVSLPRAADRWIPPIPSARDPLAGLNALLPLEGILGRPLDELSPRPGGRAELHGLGAFVDPPDDSPPAIVYGNVVDEPTPGTVVVAVNGTVVAGSELFEQDGRPGTFAAMLPADVLRDRGNEIRIALLDGDDVVELDVAEQ